MGDYYTLDDMFETSSASKESQAVKDEKLKRRAMTGMHISCSGVKAAGVYQVFGFSE